MEVAAVAAQLNCAAGSYKAMEIRWATSKDYQKRVSSKLKSRRIPIFISTNPSDLNPRDLKELCITCNHSFHRFPTLDHNGKLVEAVDLQKLRVALSHSSVLVSVFCNLQDASVDDNQPEEHPLASPLMGLRDLLRTLPLPAVSPSNSQLVGFGRAVSDFGLTASIYDVMVVPSLRRMGIGKMIVKRIIRLFFKACGFGDDILGSTTMMYTRSVSTYPQSDQMAKRAGRKLLILPPVRKAP
ncbi:uncharacterized protein LOC110623882 isoform X2 [Manihot esculenta]|uniref:N-acetyltransferase domain-containing protein n=1 Tax=Manihot esculenta TaxID=3983 RepID=A0A2C9V254_MANES|nr:uncharacterized protein LOC110623882 isoform X2 [Manihot esculenta]OAY38305.1 hypothetical protein MANES_10G004400v8 [Manihot esculenta]